MLEVAGDEEVAPLDDRFGLDEMITASDLQGQGLSRLEQM